MQLAVFTLGGDYGCLQLQGVKNPSKDLVLEFFQIRHSDDAGRNDIAKHSCSW